MKSSTTSLPHDTDFHESDDSEGQQWSDGGEAVPLGYQRLPVWGRPLQGPQITHVAGIPVAAWPDLAEGTPAPLPLSHAGVQMFSLYPTVHLASQQSCWYGSWLPASVGGL